MKQNNHKFIEIVPYYNMSYKLISSEDYMALPVNSIIQDFEIVEYVIFDKNDTIDKNMLDNIKLNLDNKIKTIIFNNWLNYIRYLWENRDAVIFANDRTLYSFIVGLIVKKSVFMSHQSNLPAGKMKQVAFKFFITKFKKIKVSNPYERDTLIGFGVPSEKIEYIPLAIDHNFFVRYSEKRNMLRKQNGYENSILLLYLGNIRKFKNPYNLMNAYKIVSNQFNSENKLQLLFVGSDMLSNEGGPSLKEYAAKIGIEIDHVDFVQHKDAIKYMQMADIGVIPSYHEGQCIVAYEYASMQIPMCLSTFGSFTSVFKDCALFSDPDDSDALAENIMKYMNDKKLAEEHGKKAREIVIERCDYDTVKERLRNLFVGLK